MAEKKLDKLFQEQLKNLEVSPNKRVWNNIETKLSKKKRKVFPFWWFTSAVASILALVFLFYPISKEENQNFKSNSKEIITTAPKDKSLDESKGKPFNFDKNNNNDVLVSKEEKINKVQKKTFFLEASFIKKKEYQAKKIQERLAILKVNAISININSLLQNETLDFSTIKELKKTSQKLNIENIVKAKENNQHKKETKNWSIAPTFAVLQSNSLTDSSPINSSLASSTSGENSYSYGVQIAYKFNNKWSIQSGIHRQEISFANNQIVVNRSSERNPFATQFSNGDSFSFDVSSNSVNAINSDSVEFSRSFFSSTVESNNGSVFQNYGYIEIPVELKYNFSNNSNKLQIQLVSGFSSLFLNKNQVTLHSQNFSRNLEASNLNTINFSGNLGFDFNYYLNKSWSFNLNPMFKAQLNTFSDNGNGFAPFQLGLYSGIRFQF